MSLFHCEIADTDGEFHIVTVEMIF